MVMDSNGGFMEVENFSAIVQPNTRFQDVSDCKLGAILRHLNLGGFLFCFHSVRVERACIETENQILDLDNIGEHWGTLNT